MKEFYVIVRESWDYNDEYYFQPEGQPYSIVESKFFEKEEDAQKECDKLNEKTAGEVYKWDDDEEDEINVNQFKVIKLTENGTN